MTSNILLRFGVAAARLLAAGCELLTSGWAATTNGRIWFLTIGVLGLDERDQRGVRRTAAPARPAAGWSPSARAPSRTSATFCERRCRLAERAGQIARSPARCCRPRMRTRGTPWRSSRRAGRSGPAWSASAVFSRCSELTSCRRSAPRTAIAPLTRARSRWVGSKRSSTWASSEPPLPARPCARSVDSSCEVRARVGVERAEDLVDVDVRERVRDRDREARLGDRRRAAARVDSSMNMSFSPVFGRSSARRVLVDQLLVLRVDVHLHDRDAVLQRDAADRADLNAGDAHGLSLARRHRLRGRELAR